MATLGISNRNSASLDSPLLFRLSIHSFEDVKMISGLTSEIREELREELEHYLPETEEEENNLKIFKMGFVASDALLESYEFGDCFALINLKQIDFVSWWFLGVILALFPIEKPIEEEFNVAWIEPQEWLQIELGKRYVFGILRNFLDEAG